MFTSFATENNYDGLLIYDGPNTSSPLISSGLGVGSNATTCPAGSWRGSGSPGTVFSTASCGSLTFRFRSDGSTTAAGWAATITCEEYESATYSSGHGETKYIAAPTTANNSSCPIDLSVTIPIGATITGVDVEYTMTALGSAYRSEQRSYLQCISTDGIKEASISSGVGGSAGTYSYSRTNLNIANGVSGGGTIDFRLHAFRTWQGAGDCNITYNRVDDNSFKIRVFYEPVACFPPTSPTSSAITTTTATVSWTAPDDAPDDGYEYEIRTSGAAGSGAGGLEKSGSTAGGVVSANISDLTIATTYSLYVRSDCGSGAYSIWTDAHVFETDACVAPNGQATSFSATSVAEESMTINWARGNGDKVLVLARLGGAVNSDPINGDSYTANAAFGNGDEIGTGNYVIYNNDGTNVDVTNLNFGTEYHFAIYEYDESENCYNKVALTGNRATLDCTQPGTQANSFSASLVTANSMTVNWARGNGTGGVIVLGRAGGAVSSHPISGTTYTANAAFGSGDEIGTGNYVLYIGTGTSVNLTGLIGTTYHFAIYEYNLAFNCYKASPLVGSQMTDCEMGGIFSNSDANAHNTWNSSNNWATALTKEIEVSGLCNESLVIKQININLGSTSLTDVSTLQARLIDPEGNTVNIMNSGYFPSTGVSSWKYISIRLRDHEQLKTPKEINGAGTSYMAAPYAIGYYRVETEGSFSNFNTTNQINGTWTLQFIENTATEIAFISADLVFGTPFNYVDIRLDSDNTDCDNARCVQSGNNEILLATNVGYPQNQNPYPSLNFSGTCNWNAEKNNTSWFYFEPTSTDVTISISGFDNTVQQTIVLKIDGGNCSSSPTYTVVGCPTSMFTSTDPHQYLYYRTEYFGGTRFNHEYKLTGLTVGDHYLFINDGSEGANSKCYIEVASGADKGCTGPLPISLADYFISCENNYSIVNWATYSEDNNDFFTIERSSNAKDWEIIEYIRGAGNSNNKIYYRIKDDNPIVETITYYRLKQTDYDGKYKYFKTLAANCNNETNENIIIYPNPVFSNGILNIQHNFSFSKNVNVEIKSITGMCLYTNLFEIDEYNSIITINLNNTISQGIYFITVKSEFKVYTRKFIIK